MAKPEVKVVVKNAKKEVPKTPKAPDGCLIAKAGKYKVLKKCYMGIRLYKEGDIYEAQDGEILSKDIFVRAKKFIEVED